MVRIKLGHPMASIAIVDASGRVIYKGQGSAGINTINTSTLQSGTYYIVVQVDGKSQPISVPFIRQ
jgi:hypothetical protein